MGARQQSPSMMDLCNIFRKRNEFMRKSNQPNSEFKETHDSCDPFSEPTAASEQKYSRESDETRRNWPMRFANDTQRPTRLIAGHESGISSSFTEMEDNFLHSERRGNHARFSPPVEFCESDVGSSSSDEEFRAFDYCHARPNQFYKRQVQRKKTRNAKLYRTTCLEMSPTQGRNTPRTDATETEISPSHFKSLHQASFSANHANLPECSHCQAYLPNQVNSRGRPNYQSSHHSSNRTNCQEVLHHQANSSLSTNTRDVYSIHQVRDKHEKQTRHQTIRSASVHLQQQMQREESGSPERRNTHSNRAVTTLPPIQQHIRKTTDRSRQSHPPAEQQNQIISPQARRRGRQEVCDVRNSGCCRRRRTGVCKETDTSQEYRTFVRVLEKRF